MSQKSKDLPDEDIPAFAAFMTVGLCVTALMIAVTIWVYVALDDSAALEGDGWKAIFIVGASIIGALSIVGILMPFKQWLLRRRKGTVPDIMDDGDDSGEYSD